MNTSQALHALLPENVACLDTARFAPLFDGSIHTMAKPKFLAVLNRLVGLMSTNEVYLEVGTYQGGSLCGAMLGNERRAIGVDDFSGFPATSNETMLTQNLKRFNLSEKVAFYNMGYKNFFNGLVGENIRVGLYYYDGAHDDVSTEDGLERGFPFVNVGGFLVLDDTSYAQVQEGLNRFLGKHPRGVRVAFCAQPDNLPGKFDDTWWNGTVILEKTGGK